MKIQVHEDISYQYGTSQRHKFDIYFPQISPAVVPLVVYIHGGAWRTGDKSEFRQIAKGIISASQNRLVVAIINYELSTRSADSARHPEHLNDAMAAVRFLVTDQSYPGRSIVDHNQVFLVGHSAGAHLSALMTLAPHPHFAQLGNIKGVMGIAGIYNIPKLLRANPEYCDFIDMAFHTNQHDDASPHCVARTFHDNAAHVRFMVVNSCTDELVAPVQATDFAARLVTTGYKDVTLVVKDLGSHDGALLNQELWNMIVRFII
ncbi:hypothetical protein LPJ77_002473 [Coemansia sp. RSA 2523]|nr:hypothetical protein LPJ54_001837 [Coemansia sp. RSA 1824]KAJ1788519.1 hypothetical protein LPJ62_002838 [Coemansia sp. RSA 2167]KAJ1808255.1 hypothetical protein LPJ77_002473 [Coemansia sp. RSA 2523]KAJ2152732.1 hypothetical protein J3F82_002471 [Coemansia sp. RSA 637]KAJ2247152.1 hypothetical protein GGH98_004125 [Coemansia sp. RSA 454]KAJ2426163.1 hypothetical protein GGF47_002264 [Coemansia sp. RSA 2524]KAJ2445185.1 hypothetical protein IWW46_001628 [Coemansia sp. RSA 2440]KAJ2526868.